MTEQDKIWFVKNPAISVPVLEIGDKHNMYFLSIGKEIFDFVSLTSNSPSTISSSLSDLMGKDISILPGLPPQIHHELYEVLERYKKCL